MDIQSVPWSGYKNINILLPGDYNYCVCVDTRFVIPHLLESDLFKPDIQRQYYFHSYSLAFAL